jgi:hypothetical protein
MKKVTLQLVLPLTIILFFSVTKWWCVAVDAPNTLLSGFPFPYTGEAWGSSMSFQYFFFEFLIDLAVYFAMVFTATYFVYRYLVPRPPHKVIFFSLYIIATLFVTMGILMISATDSFFYFYREFEIKTINTEYLFIGQRPPDCF